jgi:hypothetical protein
MKRLLSLVAAFALLALSAGSVFADTHTKLVVNTETCGSATFTLTGAEEGKEYQIVIMGPGVPIVDTITLKLDPQDYKVQLQSRENKDKSTLQRNNDWENVGKPKDFTVKACPPPCEWNPDISSTDEACVEPTPEPTPKPVLPTFQTSCEAITVAGVTEGWQFIVEPGDKLLSNGKTALEPGKYTYGLRYEGNDIDSGSFTIDACATEKPNVTPKPTPKPTSTVEATEETTLPPTDTISSTTGGTGGNSRPLVLILLTMVSTSSLLLTTKRFRR